MAKAGNTASDIISAANRIIQREGSAQFSLENVAAEAGVSKGGLLYHFPSKKALLEEMIHALISEYEKEMLCYINDVNSQKGAAPAITAYALATFSMGAKLKELSSGMLAAIANDTELLDPLRKKMREWKELIQKDDLPQGIAMLIKLAVDGLWYADLLQIDPPSESEHRYVQDSLFEIIESYGKKS